MIAIHERRLVEAPREAERTHRGDPAYGFRKLVDGAQRALGTADNDATTAAQVINRLHDCLRQIAPRPLPAGEHVDEQGKLRLVVQVISWEGYVRLAFDEIRLAAGGYPQATRRLRAALGDLKTVAPPDRRAPLDRQLRLLRRAVEDHLETEEDLRAALILDQQGIGSGRMSRVMVPVSLPLPRIPGVERTRRAERSAPPAPGGTARSAPGTRRRPQPAPW